MTTGDAWDFDENTPVESNRRVFTAPKSCDFCGHTHRENFYGSSSFMHCGVPMFGVGGDPCRFRRCRCRGEAPPQAPSLEGLFWSAPNHNWVNTIHAFLPDRHFGLCGRGGLFIEGKDLVIARNADVGRQKFCGWCQAVIHGVLKGTRTELPR